MSNLSLRVVSAIVLAIVALGATWLGGLAFRLFAAVIGLAILYEWATMSGLARHTAAAWTTGALMAVLALAMLVGLSGLHLFGLLLLATVLTALSTWRMGLGWWPPAGVAYAGLSMIALAGLRGDGGAGFWTILFLFAVVWATDIFAYFVGRAVGGPKLAPAISPGKTWSGAIGGAACAVIAGALLLAYGGGAVSVAAAILILFLSAVSQVGDLFESWVKRKFGAKDSSRLIPGHGGVMDRVDGLVAAAAALYVIGGLAAGGTFAGPLLF